MPTDWSIERRPFNIWRTFELLWSPRIRQLFCKPDAHSGNNSVKYYRQASLFSLKNPFGNCSKNFSTGQWTVAKGDATPPLSVTLTNACDVTSPNIRAYFLTLLILDWLPSRRPSEATNW